MSDELPEGSGAEELAAGAPPEASEGGDQGGLPPEIASVVDAEIKKAVDGLRRKYEGPEGDIAKAKSAADKRVAKAERELEALREVRLKEAERVARSDPARAYQIQREVMGDLQRQRQADNIEQDWSNWVQKQYEDAGLDIETDENAAEAADAVQRLVQYALAGQGDAQAAAFTSYIAGKGLEAERARTKKATTELDKLREDVPALVKAQVARALTEMGLSTPDDAGEPRGGTTESWRGKSPRQQIIDGLAEARKEAASRRTSKRR